MSNATVDVHTHFIPQIYLEALAEAGVSAKDIGFPLAPWNTRERLALQDKNGIRTEILSLSSPGLRFFPGRTASLCRELNDALAGLVRDHPARFGGLATLPLPDVDASLAEIARAYDDLALDGIVLMSNYGGTYPGDPKFAPVLQELDRRHAVVFIHPTEAAGNAELTFGYPAPMVEYPAETTRTVVNLLDQDTITRFPNIRWIVSHGGGSLPMLITRIEELFPWKRKTDPEAVKAKLAEQIASLYWDMAIVCYEAPLRAISASHPASRLLMGFDLPFYPSDQIAVAKRNLGEFAGFSDEEKRAIDFGNAHELFPRIARANVAGSEGA